MLVTFPDVVAAGVAALAAGLSDRPEPYVTGAAVRTHHPASSDDAPVVQVAKDSDQVSYPIISRSTLRVTVWHSTEAYVTDLSSLCQGILLSSPGDIEATQSLTGPIPGVDSDTGLHFAYFTVAAVMHATVL